MAGTTTTRTAGGAKAATKAGTGAKTAAKAGRIRWAAMPAMPANLLIEHDPTNRYRVMVDGAWRPCTGRDIAGLLEASPGSGAGGATGASAPAGAGKARGRATAGR